MRAGLLVVVAFLAQGVCIVDPFVLAVFRIGCSFAWPLSFSFVVFACAVMLPILLDFLPVPHSKPKQQPPEPSTVNPSPALLARVVAAESCLDTLEARSSNVEAQLQNGFSQILARLDDRSSASRRPAESNAGESLPPKNQGSQQPKAQPAALADAK
eukprot:s395_g7.t1